LHLHFARPTGDVKPALAKASPKQSCPAFSLSSSFFFLPLLCIFI
jgi:hypothetical protein